MATLLNAVASWAACYNVLLQGGGVADTTNLPVGNGRLAGQVWIDSSAPRGTLSLYATMDGMLTGQVWQQKAGRVDVNIGNIDCSNASWWLDVPSGTAHISCGGGSTLPGGADIIVGVSHTDNTLFVAGDIADAAIVTASAFLWRVNRSIPSNNGEWRNALGLCDATNVIERADTVVQPGTPGLERLVWYQRNSPQDSIWQSTLNSEGLDGWTSAPSARDPLANLTYGALVWGDAAFSAVNGTTLRSTSAVKTFSLGVRTYAAQLPSADTWIANITDLPLSVAEAVTNRTALLDELLVTASWWADRWNRSHLIVTPSSPQAALADPCGNASTTAAAFNQVSSARSRRGLAPCESVTCIRSALGIVEPTSLSIPAISVATGGVPAFRGKVSTAYQVTQTGVLDRYMALLQSFGSEPIRFNGGLLTWTPSPSYGNFTPDYRQWGSGLWLQNTRLMYWPALATGDYDAMDSYFTYVVNLLPYSEFKVATKLNHSGGILAETMYPWGSWLVSDYGCANPPSAPDIASPYIGHHYAGSYEALSMAVDRYLHTHDDNFLNTTVIPIARTFLAFTSAEYPRDANGVLDMRGARAAETWHNCTNSITDVVANQSPNTLNHYVHVQCVPLPNGLCADLGGLLRAIPVLETLRSQLPSDLVTLLDALAKLPPVPIDNNTVVPCSNPDYPAYGASNAENTELYGMFPYNIVGINRTNGLHEAGVRGFGGRRWPGNTGWNYDAQAAAILGLTPVAQSYVLDRVTTRTAADSLFPAYYDWIDSDWVPNPEDTACVRMTTQLMALQNDADDSRILLLPAWPTDWHVDFKLHAPQSTIIEGYYDGGAVVVRSINPPSRAADIVILGPTPPGMPETELALVAELEAETAREVNVTVRTRGRSRYIAGRL